MKELLDNGQQDPRLKNPIARDPFQTNLIEFAKIKEPRQDTGSTLDLYKGAEPRGGRCPKNRSIKSA